MLPIRDRAAQVAPKDGETQRTDLTCAAITFDSTAAEPRGRSSFVGNPTTRSPATSAMLDEESIARDAAETRMRMRAAGRGFFAIYS
ncbi:hypothetical protein DM992_28380 [Burkholderia sp. JP2-270]|uniref:hypothetical protein n=1 Tax=Burkholderia sp. JP2-270 TaxID=2217913 RepID=UPI000DA3D658|nr:hypothetical protein [Burkholderia sp. JP2-270]AWV03204.1 hypothetical protein DM992_28380 [Burkholderia sp. JP2-270]